MQPLRGYSHSLRLHISALKKRLRVESKVQLHLYVDGNSIRFSPRSVVDSNSSAVLQDDIPVRIHDKAILRVR